MVAAGDSGHLARQAHLWRTAGFARKIPTSTLADRLKRLENAGILVKSAYQERPTRYAYSLSTKGEALGEILLALVNWGTKYIPGTQTLKSFEERRN